MKLDLKERIALPSILPQEGDYKTLIIKKDVVEKVRVTQDDIVEFKIEAKQDMISWDPEKDTSKEFEFTELEKDEIVANLKRLDTEKKLNEDTLGLYIKFCN